MNQSQVIKIWFAQLPNGRFGLICPWCGGEIHNNYDLHHWLIRKGQSAKNVDSPINLVPVHKHCHIHGNSKEMRKRVMEMALSMGLENQINQFLEEVKNG